MTPSAGAMSRRLLLAGAALTWAASPSACTSSGPDRPDADAGGGRGPAPTAPLRAVPLPDLAAELGGPSRHSLAAAGADLLLTGAGNDSGPVVVIRRDGLFIRIDIPGLRREPLLAADGARTFVVGPYTPPSTRPGSPLGAGVAVWTVVEGGVVAGPVILPSSLPEEQVRAVAAGPRGVVVIGGDPPAIGTASRTSGTGSRIWTSADGLAWGEPARLHRRTATAAALAASAEGFLLVGSSTADGHAAFLVSSGEGLDWADESDSLASDHPAGLALGARGLWIAFGVVPISDASRLPRAWYRRSDDQQWRESVFERGEPPDLDDPALEGRVEIAAAAVTSTSLAAIGPPAAGRDAYATLWQSPTGERWTRRDVYGDGPFRPEWLSALAWTGTELIFIGRATRLHEPRRALWRIEGV